MNTIYISHIKWVEKKVGIALSKLAIGKNRIVITAKDKKGIPYCPNDIVVDKEELIKKYGISIINKRNLKGICIPLEDLYLYFER